MKTVSKGARRKPAAYLTDGGNPVLNFINTWKKDSKGQVIDLLESYISFLNWCQDTNLVNWDQWLALELEQRCYEQDAEMTWFRVKSARNCFDELFNCLASGENVHPLIIDRFNSLAELIRPHLRYEMGEHGPELFWHGIEEELNLPLWLIISSAVKLIDSGNWRKIKKCPVCGSLFIDLSRRFNRCWCNPNTCGCLLKSKRYYAQKALPQPLCKGEGLEKKVKIDSLFI